MGKDRQIGRETDRRRKRINACGHMREQERSNFVSPAYRGSKEEQYSEKTRKRTRGNRQTAKCRGSEGNRREREGIRII